MREFDYTFQVIRSDRKTVGIEVGKDLTIRVRVPRAMSDIQIEAFVERYDTWIKKALNKQQSKGFIPLQQSEEEIAEWKKKAQEIIPERVEYYSRMMGLKPTHVSITSAQTRFGSCSGKNRLCFSYLLMQYPMEAIDYVVVHELAHIAHHNHGRQFYRLIGKYMPDYKEREKLLKNREGESL